MQRISMIVSYPLWEVVYCKRTKKSTTLPLFFFIEWGMNSRVDSTEILVIKKLRELNSRSLSLRNFLAILFGCLFRKKFSGFGAFGFNFKMNLYRNIHKDFCVGFVFAERLDRGFNGNLPAIDVDPLSFQCISDIG